MNLQEILKPVTLEHGYYDGLSIADLKAYHFKEIEMPRRRSETVRNNLTSDLWEIERRSESLALTLRLWVFLRGIWYTLVCEDRELAKRVRHHWLYRDLNRKLEFMKNKGKISICKKCGFPYLISSIWCDFCNEKDEEEYGKYWEEIKADMDDTDDDEQDDDCENDVELDDSALTQSGHYTNSCPSCGGPRNGSRTCMYCGSTFTNTAHEMQSTRKKAKPKYRRGLRCPDCNGRSEKVGLLCENVQIRVCEDCGKQFTFGHMASFISEE